MIVFSPMTGDGPLTVGFRWTRRRNFFLRHSASFCGQFRIPFRVCRARFLSFRAAKDPLHVNLPSPSLATTKILPALSLTPGFFRQKIKGKRGNTRQIGSPSQSDPIRPNPSNPTTKKDMHLIPIGKKSPDRLAPIQPSPLSSDPSTEAPASGAKEEIVLNRA